MAGHGLVSANNTCDITLKMYFVANQKVIMRIVIFLGRTGSDRLRSKGENFATTFVEEVIMQNSGIDNCAVIGIPFADSTENNNRIYVLEVHNPCNLDLDGFIAFFRKEIPGYVCKKRCPPWHLGLKC